MIAKLRVPHNPDTMIQNGFYSWMNKNIGNREDRLRYEPNHVYIAGAGWTWYYEKELLTLLVINADDDLLMTIKLKWL